MKYICTKGFAVDMYDDDGFYTGDFLEIKAGQVYTKNDSDFRVIGGKEDVRLESENGYWLEIAPETVAEYFCPAERSEK